MLRCSRLLNAAIFMFGVVAAASIGAIGTLCAQSIDSNLWVTNGTVIAMERTGNTLYIGGNFSHIGPRTGSFARVDLVTTVADSTFPKVVGTIYTVAPDGSGGWFIGGDFTEVGGVERQRLAHVLSNFTVSSWNPGADDIVHALVVDGGTVYAGGRFANIGGQVRNNIAALDASTGTPTAWNPNADFRVYTLAVSGSVVYAGGLFSNIGGQARNWLAALDKTTGLATAWDPSPNGTINVVRVDGSTVYVGGDSFNSIGGQTRSRVAAIDATTGLATSWNPGADGGVVSIAVDGSIVYLGGWFFNAGGQNRMRIAAIDKATGLATAWNPNSDNTVQDILVDAGIVYAAGYFTSIGGQTRTYLAALDQTTGLATSWDPNPNGVVLGLALDGDYLIAGGSFTSVDCELRGRVAAIDLTTAQVTSWAPDVPPSVITALVLSGNTVFICGNFTTVGGQARNYLAAIDATTGAVLPWNANANSLVVGLEVHEGLLYVAGGFTNIGGQPRNRIAALDLTTAAATSWNPSANNEVDIMEADGSTIYLGGYFSSVGGQSRQRIAAIDLATGLATAWNPGADGPPSALKVDGTAVYVGGFFSNVAGQARNNLAAIDKTSGALVASFPEADDAVRAITVSGPLVYVGGPFTDIGGQPRKGLAAIDALSGDVTGWNPDADSRAWSLLASGTTILTGGDFSKLGPVVRSGLGAISAAPGIGALLPASGGNTGPVTVRVSGSGFPAGASLALARSAPPDTLSAGPADVRADGLGLTATFDLTGVGTDAWDVVVVTPDLQIGARPDGFSVAPQTPYQLRVDIVGPPLIRANRRKAYDIVIENLGNGDVLSVPLWISGLPTTATVEPDFAIAAPSQEGGEPDWSLAPLTLDGPGGRYLALVIPRLPPGISVRRIYITVPPAVTGFTLDAALTPPWVSGSALENCLSGAGVITAQACLGRQLDAIESFLASASGIEAVNGIGVWAKDAWQCEGSASLAAALVKSEQVLDFMLQAVEGSGVPSGCETPLAPRWQRSFIVGVVGSIDPNIKVGTTGVGLDQQIGIEQNLPYSIRFENLETATAPAQEVVVIDPLDGATLDLATLNLSAITFGDRTLFPPPGLTQFTTEVDLRPQEDVIVRVSVNLDNATGVLSWSFTALDPATGQLPENPLVGFLPPNVTPPEGEGSLLFTVRPKPSLSGGTKIANSATILFDGVPLVTPAWSNLLDRTAPDSQVLPLPANQDSASFTVRWDASGSPPDLHDYSVYVSENGNPYRPWRLNTTATADTFTAPGGVTYAFYSLARDSSGNLEAVPASPDAQTFSGVAVPREPSLSLALHGAIPNPTTGGARIWFTLPSRTRTLLEVMDVAGRRVLKREVGGLGPGRHSVDVSESIGRPGLYFLKLTQGDRVQQTRMVVLR